MQINDDRPQCFAFVAGGFEESRFRAGVDQLNACGRPRPARYQEAGPGLGNFERQGSERSFGIVADFFEAADPVTALVIAPHVAAARGNRVALNGLALERLAFGLPVFEGARFEVEIERFAILADGPDACRRGGVNACEAGEDYGNPQQTNAEKPPFNQRKSPPSFDGQERPARLGASD